jgi:hypothetical protein
MACSQATHADSRSQFSSPQVPCANPYGGDDIGRNAGFVNGETDHDTGAFAVASIRDWWRTEGRRLYPAARTSLIAADGGAATDGDCGRKS